jgi:hypothetical protein
MANAVEENSTACVVVTGERVCGIKKKEGIRCAFGYLQDGVYGNS